MDASVRGRAGGVGHVWMSRGVLLDSQLEHRDDAFSLNAGQPFPGREKDVRAPAWAILAVRL